MKKPWDAKLEPVTQPKKPPLQFNNAEVAKLPEGYTAPLSTKTTREISSERIANLKK